MTFQKDGPWIALASFSFREECENDVVGIRSPVVVYLLAPCLLFRPLASFYFVHICFTRWMGRRGTPPEPVAAFPWRARLSSTSNDAISSHPIVVLPRGRINHGIGGAREFPYTRPRPPSHATSFFTTVRSPCLPLRPHPLHNSVVSQGPSPSCVTTVHNLGHESFGSFRFRPIKPFLSFFSSLSFRKGGLSGSAMAHRWDVSRAKWRRMRT